MPGGSLDVGGLGFIGRCASWTVSIVQVGPFLNAAVAEKALIAACLNPLMPSNARLRTMFTSCDN